MKKHVLFITLLSALMLACSSHNGADQKAKQDTLQSDSIKDTLASDFEDLLTYFTSKDRDTLPIPDKYCYEFFGMKNSDLYYKYQGFDEWADTFITDSIESFAVVRAEKILRSKNYVLLVYNVFKDLGYDLCETSGIDYSNVKIFTPNGSLIQSLDTITKYPNGNDPDSNLQFYYFKNDTILYLMTLHDSADVNANAVTSIDLTKYIISPEGKARKTSSLVTKVCLPLFTDYNGHSKDVGVSNVYWNQLNKDEKKEDYYEKWIKMAENGGK